MNSADLVVLSGVFIAICAIILSLIRNRKQGCNSCNKCSQNSKCTNDSQMCSIDAQHNDVGDYSEIVYRCNEAEKK